MLVVAKDFRSEIIRPMGIWDARPFRRADEPHPFTGKVPAAAAPQPEPAKEKPKAKGGDRGRDGTRGVSAAGGGKGGGGRKGEEPEPEPEERDDDATTGRHVDGDDEPEEA